MNTKTPAWLWVAPLLSCGCLSFAPPLAIAVKLKTRNAWLWFGGFSAAWIVAFTIIGSQPEGSESTANNLAVGLYLLTAVGATVYSVVKAQEVSWGPPPVAFSYASPPSVAPPTYDANAAAIANVQAIRQKRSEARAIIQRDPQMARDLRIGRPDLPRHFDDGGLVDINSAPQTALVRGLNLSEEQAATILDARRQLGRFQHPDDLMNLAGLDSDSYQEIRDRVVLL